MHPPVRRKADSFTHHLGRELSVAIVIALCGVLAVIPDDIAAVIERDAENTAQTLDMNIGFSLHAYTSETVNEVLAAAVEISVEGIALRLEMSQCGVCGGD